MLYSKSKKFLFIHIYKTGGTAVSAYFKKFLDNKVNNNNIHIHSTFIEITKMIKEDINNIFTFSTIRNPWDWQLSLYNHIKRIPSHPDFNIINNISFNDYISWLNDEGIHREKNRNPTIITRKPRYLTFFDFLKDENENISIDYICKFETLEKDINLICENLNIVNKNKFKTKGRSLKNKHYKDFYNENSKKIISKIFEKDIDHFKYSF